MFVFEPTRPLIIKDSSANPTSSLCPPAPPRSHSLKRTSHPPGITQGLSECVAQRLRLGRPLRPGVIEELPGHALSLRRRPRHPCHGLSCLENEFIPVICQGFAASLLAPLLRKKPVPVPQSPFHSVCATSDSWVCHRCPVSSPSDWFSDPRHPPPPRWIPLDGIQHSPSHQ